MASFIGLTCLTKGFRSREGSAIARAKSYEATSMLAPTFFNSGRHFSTTLCQSNSFRDIANNSDNLISLSHQPLEDRQVGHPLVGPKKEEDDNAQEGCSEKSRASQQHSDESTRTPRRRCATRNRYPTGHR
mmetsp:Transcript_42257/g.62614  ORF Transcript_42257/g.62614 Transcript_42257/m.62614 type:complete len:131 (-) Transcript_42257:346-738(-)